MDKQTQIRNRLKEIAQQVGPTVTMLAQVKSVDEGEMTCVLYDAESDLDFFDVRLRPVIDGKEFLTILPKVDSWVLAVRLEDDDEWQAIAFGEVDKWRLKIGEAIIEQDAAGLLIQKQSDTLKQILQLVIEAVQVTVVLQGTNPDYTKLTQAMTKLNNLLR